VANGRPAWASHDTPHDLAMLAHELRRRVAALRVTGEGRADQTATDAVAAVRAAARTVATARGVDIRVEAPPAAVVVRASATMLRQAVENLLDNAASHGGAADVEVAVRPDPDRGEVDVVVADGGPEGSREPQRGAPVDRGTDAGATGLPTASGVRAGHGIGLFLVRRFLDAAGGGSRGQRARAAAPWSASACRSGTGRRLATIWRTPSTREHRRAPRGSGIAATRPGRPG
jgi:signal transduction histidine kinase